MSEWSEESLMLLHCACSLFLHGSQVRLDAGVSRHEWRTRKQKHGCFGGLFVLKQGLGVVLALAL